MNFRQAKKILFGNTNLVKRFNKLRPPDLGRMVYPSWHDIDIVQRARTVFRKHYRRHKK